MKLLNKLTLYHTLSKTAIVILFICLLPVLIKGVAFRYTNYALQEQEKKVFSNINKKGIDYYFDGDSTYGSYTMLKEEYISLERASLLLPRDTILTSERVIEGDTLNYRVLTRVFLHQNKKYVLEIGRTINSIDQYNRPLQRVALYVLIGLIAATLLIDLVFTRLLLRPLGLIIKTKLINRRFPFHEEYPPVKTSTTDFKYLDDTLIDLMDRVKTAFDKEREFTSNASHELMTPLAILENKMENLMDNDASEELQEKIMGMMQTLNRLKKIVRSLLLISRIDNNQFMKNDSINVSHCIQELLTELEDRLLNAGIRVHTAIAEKSQLQSLNKDLFFQLLYNLVNNAIRYNKTEGEIFIREVAAPGSYALIIEDTGKGIAEQDLPFIFDRFKKSSGGDGFGIGLSIVKSIAFYHTVNITVKSKLQLGTVFTINFPPGMHSR